MKLKPIFCVLLINIVLSASAQTLEEWTQQKQTKIKRLLEQIAANKVYIEYAKKGYRIVSGGLHTIRDIKKGDFKLHLGHFDSLKIVNPEIKGWIKVADIIVYQARIIKTCKQAIDAVRQSGQFSHEELEYCRKVFDQLFDECLKAIDELLTVITNGAIEMTDDERIQRIDIIYLDMQDKFSFARSFGSDMKLLATQRLNERIELKHSNLLNGHR